jgi:hypothetical protein
MKIATHIKIGHNGMNSRPGYTGGTHNSVFYFTLFFCIFSHQNGIRQPHFYTIIQRYSLWVVYLKNGNM